MNCYPYQIDANVLYGHAILGELPNTFGSNPLPLLVREAVQNSLDAGREDANEVKIHFSLRSIPGRKLEKILQHTYFGDTEVLFLEISDHGTTGLDGKLGPITTSTNDMGRFWRFALSMGVNQTKAGAGGSWGMGKSIYHHAGTGLLLIDSLIDDNERRFCAKCIVDERISTPEWLEANSGTGIYFWGQEKNYPVTDPRSLEETYTCLGIPKRTEPGTSFYIMLKKDLACHYLDSDLTDSHYAYESLMQRIQEEVQKWYFPRLGPNPRHRLVPSYDNLHEDFMQIHPMVERLHSLYEQAKLLLESQKESDHCRLLKINDTILATLAWEDCPIGTIKKQGWKRPGQFIGTDENLDPSSICAMARGAGMVVKYDTTILGPPPCLTTCDLVSC